MNDSQQIPNALKDYAQAKGLTIDHNFFLTISRYQTNLFLSSFGLGFFFPILFINDLGVIPSIIAGFFSGIIIGVFTLAFWSVYIGIRMLYIKKSWFPIKTSGESIDMNYKNIMNTQGSNLKIILCSYLFSFLWFGFIYVSIVRFNYDIANLYPFSYILYLSGILSIMVKSLYRYYKSKTIMYIPIE